MSLPVSDKEETTVHYAETIFQLLAGVDDPARAVGRAKASWSGSRPDFRSMLRAAGAFARDNDGYFVRYENEAELEEPLPLPEATHLFVFPVPVEPRMRVAYSYMQGIFLKYLYARHEAIPREVRQGWAEVVCNEGKPLPGANELWADFLKSELAESSMEVSARGWISGYGLGKKEVDDSFLSESYLTGLAKATVAADEQRRFHPQLYTIPAYRREDLGNLADRDYLKFGESATEEFRKRNKSKELSTVQIYKFLEEKAEEIPEFRDLVDEVISAVNGEDSRKEISLLTAAQKLEELFRAEFVPLVSNQTYTNLAIPDLTRYLLLWDLVERLPESESGRITFLGWDLSYLRRVKKIFDTPELRGSLKFTRKNKPLKKTNLLVKIVGFDKLKAEIRFVPEKTDPVESAPFELWSFGNHRTVKYGVESGGKVCTVCGKGGDLSKAGILPESKKRHYDNPQVNNPSDVCARCVQVASLAPISTAGDDYAIVEVPVENFLELFALYESLEGISRLETLKTLNRVSSLSVFPNKYLLLSRKREKGGGSPLPQTAQYYLQLARHPHFMERLGASGGNLEVIAAQDRAKLKREVALTLSVLQRLPYYSTTNNDEKVPAMSIIGMLERGRPYEALYEAAKRAHASGLREAQVVSDGIKDGYDEQIKKFEPHFVGEQKGAMMRQEFFQDVQEFSDYLDSILRPLVKLEANEGSASVSGIARKYTGDLATNFSENGVQKFMYQVSSFVESRERKSKGKESWPKINSRKIIYGLESSNPPEPGTKTVLEQKFLSYQSKYSEDKQTWKRFLREVEMRLLSLLLLNVRNKSQA